MNQFGAAWALAFLRGRLEAFRDHKLTSNNVAGAVRLALRRGAAPEQVAALLTAHGFAWEPAAQTIRAPA